MPRPLLFAGLGILTGDPLMLTKALVLLTDLFTGGFWFSEDPLEMEDEALGVPLSGLPTPGHTGEWRSSVWDGE